MVKCMKCMNDIDLYLHWHMDVENKNMSSTAYWILQPISHGKINLILDTILPAGAATIIPIITIKILYNY